MTAIADRAIGRNPTRVESSADGLVFIKDVIGPEADAERRYRNCVRFHEAQVGLGREISPPLIRFDDDERRLVYPFVQDADSLQDVLADWGRTGWQEDHALLPMLGAVAELLALVHSMPVTGPAGAPIDPPADITILDPARKFRWLTAAEYEQASGAELACWRLFHHDVELREAVTSWAESLQNDRSVVHGDVRPDQFLVAPDGVLILDWEEFGIGSASRDLAGIAGSIVFEVLEKTFALPVPGPAHMLEAHQHYVANGAENLKAAEPAMHHLVAAYEATTNCRIDPIGLSRNIGFYLVERVIGRSMLSARLSAADKAIAGIARNVLTRPTLLAGLVESKEN